MNYQSNPTFKEAHRWASSFLNSAHLDEEIAYHFMLDLAGLTPGDWMMAQHKLVPAHVWAAYQQGLAKIVKENYPWQYIVGFAWFYGHQFQVTEATLIPRQETEQLVEEIVARIHKGEIPSDAQVVDIGTGSGAIAITLKLLVPTLQVTATDISAEAIAIAQENAARLNAEVQFLTGDLYAPLQHQHFDVIVSNPPYIGGHEKGDMGVDVLKYEPAQALFAAEDGFAIYWRLLADLPAYLNAGGWFFAEFGYRQGPALQQRFQQQLPHSSVSIKKDYANLDRMLIVQYLK